MEKTVKRCLSLIIGIMFISVLLMNIMAPALKVSASSIVVSSGTYYVINCDNYKHTGYDVNGLYQDRYSIDNSNATDLQWVITLIGSNGGYPVYSIRPVNALGLALVLKNQSDTELELITITDSQIANSYTNGRWYIHNTNPYTNTVYNGYFFYHFSNGKVLHGDENGFSLQNMTGNSCLWYLKTVAQYIPRTSLSVDDITLSRGATQWLFPNVNGMSVFQSTASFTTDCYSYDYEYTDDCIDISPFIHPNYGMCPKITAVDYGVATVTLSCKDTTAETVFYVLIPEFDGLVYFKNVQSDLFLSRGSTIHTGYATQEYDKTGQSWYAYLSTDGYYSILDGAQEYALCIYNNSSQSNTPAVITSFDENNISSGQKFRILKESDGYYHIYPKCSEVNDYQLGVQSTTPGDYVGQGAPIPNSSFEKWKITKLNDAHYYSGSYNNSAAGVEATITLPSELPDVSCSGESAWVSSKSDAYNHWLQIGVRYWAYLNSFWEYCEYYDDELGIMQKRNIASIQLGSSQNYRVEYDAALGVWKAYKGNLLIELVETSKLYNNSGNDMVCGVRARAESHKYGIDLGPFVFSNVMTKDLSNNWSSSTSTLAATDPYAYVGTPDAYIAYGPGTIYTIS